MTEICYGTYEY